MQIYLIFLYFFQKNEQIDSEKRKNIHFNDISLRYNL
jgi:hypothetical protein